MILKNFVIISLFNFSETRNEINQLHRSHRSSIWLTRGQVCRIFWCDLPDKCCWEAHFSTSLKNRNNQIKINKMCFFLVRRNYKAYVHHQCIEGAAPFTMTDVQKVYHHWKVKIECYILCCGISDRLIKPSCLCIWKLALLVVIIQENFFALCFFCTKYALLFI